MFLDPLTEFLALGALFPSIVESYGQLWKRTILGTWGIVDLSMTNFVCIQFDSGIMDQILHR